MGEPVYALSADRMTLVVKRRTPGGILTATYHSKDDAGFTDAAVALAVNNTPAASCGMRLPGQRNTTRRAETRFGTVWTHVMTGPPTWWLPRLKRERDGTLMAGWLRLAAAVKLEWQRNRPARPAPAGDTTEEADDGE